MRFEGKSTVITGGAGGIGRVLVELFAREGAQVLFCDLDEKASAELSAELRERGQETRCLAGDLGQRTFCEKLIAEAVRAHDGIDILINNAGIIPRGTILETSDDMWQAALDVNLSAVFYLCRAAIPVMRGAGGGAIVNTASTWGLYPGPGHLAYCTSKGALAAMTRCLGRDHAPDGIRVNAVCPNEVDTPMLRSGFERRGIDPETAIEDLGRTVPLGHVASPAEIADVIAFLASSEARYVCGATIEVSGAKAVYG